MATPQRRTRQLGLRWFVLPPRSPQLNGRVERAQPTPTEEFQEVIPDSFPLPALPRDLRAWERIDNPVRPHPTLGSLTPLEFLTQTQSLSQKAKCHSSTGRVHVSHRGNDGVNLSFGKSGGLEGSGRLSMCREGTAVIHLS